VGKATMVRTTVVKTHGGQRELNPTVVEPPTIRHLPLEHTCSGQRQSISSAGGSGINYVFLTDYYSMSLCVCL
jgi:hypothetical protein